MKLIPTSLSRVVARQSLKVQANSPTLLFGAGVVGMVGSTVLACRATLRLDEIAEKVQADVRTAKEMQHPEYSEDDRRRDLMIIYSRGLAKTVRLYAPSLLLGAASIGALTKSHNILQERNLALTAAYAAVDEAFKVYRERVIEKYGEEQDREFRYETETIEIVDDKGKTISQLRVGPNEHSMYARFFDQVSSSSWSKEPEYNLIFLHHTQNWCNDLLLARGHLFLNEVYDALGFERTKPGQVVGWMISELGDNYVDFGVWEGTNQASRDFVNGREGAILLDFNVDGVIYDKINNYGEKLRWQR